MVLLTASLLFGTAPSADAWSKCLDGFDYDAVLTVGPEQMRDSAYLERVSWEYFEAYIARTVHPVLRFIPRMHFKKVSAWTMPFVQGHFTSMELRFTTLDIAGKERLVQATRTRYNGHEVEFLKFRNGIHASNAIRIDGVLVLGKDGKEPMILNTGGRRRFERFVIWFEKRLGPPPAAASNPE